VRIALLGLLLFSACSKGQTTVGQQPARRDAGGLVADADPSKLEGKALYTALCSHCHGPNLEGYKSDNAPSLKNPTFLESATDDFLVQSIGIGRPGTSMAGYSRDIGGPLDKPTVDRLVAYIRAQGPQAKQLPVQNSTGDAVKGQLIYTRDCQKCHGDPTVRMTAVHLANPKFLEIASDAFLRYAIVNGRPGTQMEAFGTKLQAAEIEDVVAYVRSFAKPVEIGSLPPPTGKEPLFINPNGKPPQFKDVRPDPGQTLPRYVSVDEVKKALDDKRKMIIIDARPASDWMRVHVTGAVSIPYHDMTRLDEIPKDAYAIAYCACPHHLSGVVVDELVKRGYKHALVLDEGILEWHRRGYPVVAAPGVTPPPKEEQLVPINPPPPGVVPKK
jgi:mono/diheme cytochrome c family protein/rhodanese-related sulfurtransferase